MKGFAKYLFIVSAALSLSACLENDIPYPKLDCSMTDIKTEGIKSFSTVTRGDSTYITLSIDETTDLREVGFKSITTMNQDLTKLTYADGSDISAGDKWNMRKGVTLYATIYGYRKVWVFSATQTVDYRFTVEGQIGDAVFEQTNDGGVENRIALALVPAGTDFSKINITSLKLGPEGCTTITPSISGVTDFSDKIKKVTVTYRDVTEQWRVMVKEGETSVTKVNAWGKIAWVSAAGVAGEHHAIEYRQKGASEWSSATITDAGSVFSAKITGLTATTDYECRAKSGATVSDVTSFKTETTPQLISGGLNDWNKDDKCWNPWAITDNVTYSFYDTHSGVGEQRFDIRYWDTGNHGAVTLGESNSIPLSEAVTRGWCTDGTTPKEGTDAAYLRTKFVGIGVAGKLAGGNIYAGTFGIVQGTNGTTYLGVPCSTHPTKLVGYYKYQPKNIDYVLKANSAYPNDGKFINDSWKGKIDSLHIVFALGNWKIPHEVRTARDDRSDFTEKTPGVLAWGDMTSSVPKTEWTRFEIELNYYDKDTTPKFMVVMITASKWCDYFTGADGSVLIVDDLSIEYE